MSKFIQKLINAKQEYTILGNGGSGDKVQYVTQEEFNALPETKFTNGIIYKIYKTGVDEAIDEQPIQVTTMPAATADNVGTVHQYIGETDSTYTKGYFYMCVSDGQAPATYSWDRVDVQPGGGSTGGLVSSDNVSYDNTTSGLTADNVQDAIDEIVQGGNESSVITFIEVGDSDLTRDSDDSRRYNISSAKTLEIMTAKEAGKNVVLCVTWNNQATLLSNVNSSSFYATFSGFRSVSSTEIGTRECYIELNGSGGIRFAYINMDKGFNTRTRIDERSVNRISTYNSALDRYVPTEDFANNYRENTEYSGEYVIQLLDNSGHAIDTLQLTKRDFVNAEYAKYDICGRVKYDSSNRATQIHIHLEFDGSANYLVDNSTFETKTIAYAS